MPKVLSQSQIDYFHEYGYCAPIDVMSEEEAHALKLRVEAAEAAHPEELGPTNRNNAHLAYTCIDEVAHHPVIVGAVSDLIGDPNHIVGHRDIAPGRKIDPGADFDYGRIRPIS